MQLIVPTPEIAHAGLRALKTIAMVDGSLNDLEERMLESVQEHVCRPASIWTRSRPSPARSWRRRSPIRSCANV